LFPCEFYGFLVRKGSEQVHFLECRREKRKVGKHRIRTSLAIFATELNRAGEQHHYPTINNIIVIVIISLIKVKSKKSIVRN